MNLSAVRSPSAVTFDNGWRSYTLTGGAINCTRALVKNGDGAVLAGGRMAIQNVNALGTGSLTLAGSTAFAAPVNREAVYYRKSKNRGTPTEGAL